MGWEYPENMPQVQELLVHRETEGGKNPQKLTEKIQLGQLSVK